VRDPQGFFVLDLAALVRMKLTSNRRIDQVHIEDFLRMDLIDDAVRSVLTPTLIHRLDDIRQTMEE
jgi:hypothetical protein